MKSRRLTASVLNNSLLGCGIVFISLFVLSKCQGSEEDNLNLGPISNTRNNEIQQCPLRCLCFRTTVRCMFLNLDRIPNVGSETTIL